MRPLAIIERDASQALQLLGALEAAGFRGAVFTAATPALPLLRERHFALALLDLCVTDVPALEVCREISPFTPIITLASPRAAMDACMSALESGADDCICRGIGARELIARIRNVLRRAEPAHEDHGQLAAVVSEMRVRHDGRVDNLTAGEAAVLTALIDHAPAPMTIVEIAHAIGANRGTVESRIKSLRRKLGPARLVSRGRLGYQVE